MTEYTNEFCPVEILGPTSSSRFLRVRMFDLAAYCLDLPQDYLVFADTLRYRMDGQPHDLDVREVNVLSHEQIEGSDDQVSVRLEVKG